MARIAPVYPPELSFDGVINGTSLLRRSWSGQPLPCVYFGIGTLDDALLEADGVGERAVWFRGQIWAREVDGPWSSAMAATPRSMPARQMALEV